MDIFHRNSERERGTAVDEAPVRAALPEDVALAEVAPAAKLFSAFFDAAPGNIALIDEQGTILAVNRAWRQFADANSGDANRIGVGMNYLRVCEEAHGDCAEGAGQFAAGIGDVLSRRRDAFELEYPCHSPTERRWFHATVTRLLWNGPAHAVISHLDVSERRQELLIRAEREGYIAAILDGVLDGIATIDETGRVESMNRGAAVMFGYRVDEVVGRNIRMLMPAAEAARHDEYLANYLRTGVKKIMGAGRTVTGRRKDGSEFPIALAVSEVAVPGRRVFVGLLRDLTAERAAEEQRQRQAHELARSNAELEQFAYIASHDLQEPLRMVTSYLQLLKHRYGDRLDSDAREFIQFSVEGAARMRQLVNDLLTVSRVTTTGRTFALVDLNEVFHAARANLRLAIDECAAEVTAEPLPTLRADATQMLQLLQNLIGNAIKFRRESPPRVHVSAETRPGEIVVRVADNGIGIDPRYFEKIFLIFQRLHSRGEYPGTGIGLAVCRKIVERHDGRVWVESTPGEGSTFCVLIPTQRRSRP